VLWIDHVILAVGDLDTASNRLLKEHGLASFVGGRHIGQGTGNRIVPLGDCYIELMGVVDEAEAKTTPLASWIRCHISDGDHLAGWCLATDDLDSIAERVGVTPVPMQRRRPDGVLLSWRLAGLKVAMEEPPLPFFIEWNVTVEDHPGRAEAAHRRPAAGISKIELSGSSQRLAEWIGDHELPVHFAPGRPGVRAVEIAGDPPIRLT
jgi:hypothetical protein